MACIAPLLSLILMLIILPQDAFAAAKPRLNAVVKEMQRVYGAMDAFQASFTQKLTHRESGSFEMRNGTLLFKKPLLVRWETANPNAELLLINNKEIWNYLPDEHLVYRYPPELAQDSRTLIRVVTGQARLDQDFSVEEDGKEDGKEDGLLHLRLYPLEPTQQMVEASIWVDPAAYLIKKAIITDFFGNSNEVTFTRLDTKLKLEEKNFDFTPPKGVTVEDRSKDVVRREQIFK
ncbi:MAG: outer membrane lipoprotein carrier protein LolA [Betaproteobacteria bacterium]|nr:outer membrane lipoprotein carrier protein LolA [Betaproteobacteria bacterium]